MKLGLSSLLFVNRSIEDAIRITAELGADWAEIIFDIPHFPPGWSLEGLPRIGEMLRSCGLGVSVHASFWDINPSSHLRELRDLSLERVKRSIDACAELGGEITVVHFGRCCIPEVEWLSRQAREDYSIFLKKCAAHARRRGVRIALENPGRDPRSYPGTFEELRGLAEAEGLEIAFDVGHANLFFRRKGVRSTGAQIARCIRSMRDFIAHVHLHDNRGENDDHLPPGMGEIDFRRVIAALRGVGYNGAFVLELWDPKNPIATGRRGMEWGRKVFSEVWR